MVKGKKLVRKGREYLADREIENPRLNAELLLSHLLDCSREALLLNELKEVPSEEARAFFEFIELRGKGMPIEYIIRNASFYAREFMVEPGGFIPRPETESLVEEMLKEIDGQNCTDPLRICDLGTGTGVILITLCLELDSASGYGVERSRKGIELAKRNAGKHGISGRIEWVRGDFFCPPFSHGTTFDVVVANPPYISEDERDQLPPHVRGYEPDEALFTRGSREQTYRQVLSIGRTFCGRTGLVGMECSEYDPEIVLNIGDELGFQHVELRRDHRGVRRLFVGRI